MEIRTTKEDRQFGGRAPRFRVEASPALRLGTDAGEQELRWKYCLEGPAALMIPRAAAGQVATLQKSLEGKRQEMGGVELHSSCHVEAQGGKTSEGLSRAP